MLDRDTVSRSLNLEEKIKLDKIGKFQHNKGPDCVNKPTPKQLVVVWIMAGR
jgi:hypothetical protein